MTSYYVIHLPVADSGMTTRKRKQRVVDRDRLRYVIQFNHFLTRDKAEQVLQRQVAAKALRANTYMVSEQIDSIL